MRLIKMLFPLIIILMLAGFTNKLPLPAAGFYPVKLRTFTVFDLIEPRLEQYYNIAELIDSKPDGLALDFDPEKLRDVKYGSFKLGNNNQKVWLVMSRDLQGYWSEVYLDQDLDNRITLKERVKGLQNTQGKERGFKTTTSYSLIPIQLRVAYKGLNREFEKNLYFFIDLNTYLKRQKTDSFARLLSASFLDGEIKINTKKGSSLVKMRIVDADSNGCFNDFGKDLLLLDVNHDGYFKRNEIQPLAEYFDYQAPNQEKQQLRLALPPQPAKIAVVGATETIDWLQLEAPPDQPRESEPVKAGDESVGPPASI